MAKAGNKKRLKRETTALLQQMFAVVLDGRDKASSRDWALFG